MRRGRGGDRIELVADGGETTLVLPGADAAGDAGATADPARGLLTSALQQFYAERTAPPEIHVPIAIDHEDHRALEAWLSAGAGRRVRIVVPQRGEKRGLVELAARNAAMVYQSHFGEGA